MKASLFISNNAEFDNTYQGTGKLIECTWYVMKEDIDLDSFEFDDYKEFEESEEFEDYLIGDSVDTYFAFCEPLNTLNLALIDESNKVIWERNASEILVSSSKDLEPSDIDWSQINVEKPKDCILIRYTSVEDDSPELPIHEVDISDCSFENLTCIKSKFKIDGDSGQLIGLKWKDKELSINGEGGDGGFVEFKFYRMINGEISEIN